MLDLGRIREELDELDTQFVQLLERRLELCKDVARFKIKTGKPVLDRLRESEKLERAQKQAHGAFNEQCVRELFVQLMAMSRRLQYGMLVQQENDAVHGFKMVEALPSDGCRVVYQGVEGAYSQAAMWEYFGENVENFHVEQWRDAMEEVAKGNADYGVFPIENSTAGSVTDMYDLLADFDNTIVAEQIIPIKHALLALPGTKIEQIEKVCSHPQGLMQTANYIMSHKWDTIEVANTARAARKVVEDAKPNQAAIAAPYAAKVHGLSILEKEINDKDVNATRFIVVSNQKIYQKQASKISICFALPHEKGSLYNALANIIFNNLNMTKIESRPLGDRNWEYRFFVDFEGNLQDVAVQNALASIDSMSAELKILGNY